MTDSVTVLYFAWLRERIGTDSERLALPDGVASVADLVAHLAARGGGYAAAFANRASIRCAVNQEFADPASAVRPGDEVGFFPPVTGG
ncbi:molybdopterin converting factor subunit 1 [Rhodopila sp.]|jgi:molybdopterin synthase sulfur carrier subunit|uniref:molybdopterin converting factor subunit 1 n=1 Tax=Rhodopila sp. TaxID=2480087 RepID=UPI002D16710A|nr:molybdopterin converting factor subunit 1 [Rhodopila sp.]HVZ09130.1 molybdopterin converting factor subunit 1 [Rhodopila sp.]